MIPRPRGVSSQFTDFSKLLTPQVFYLTALGFYDKELNNIALKKNNEGYRFLLTTLAVIAIGTGLFLIVKKHQDDRERKI